MIEIFLKILNFLVISVLIQFSIATVLILFGKGKKSTPDEGGLDFSELFFEYTNVPELQTFTAKDGKNLAYRHYSSQSDKVLILVHGSGWHSKYFHPLAEFISSEGLAQVYTPDLRGHGPTPLVTIKKISAPLRNQYWLSSVQQTMPTLLNNLNP